MTNRARPLFTCCPAKLYLSYIFALRRHFSANGDPRQLANALRAAFEQTSVPSAM